MELVANLNSATTSMVSYLMFLRDFDLVLCLKTCSHRVKLST